MSGASITTTETEGATRTIKVDYLARVEGEGGLFLKVTAGKVSDVKLHIFEPPRFFEAFLRGRDFWEAPDITSRICGICPVAYQVCAVQSMEAALGVTVPDQIRLLRRLLYCGEWIESHALHVYMLHAPDFLGYQDAIAMAKDYPDIVSRGLKLKKIGNEIMTLVGGREIHPINMKVGGFYRAPTHTDLMELYHQLLWAQQASLDTVRWVSTFNFPDFERNYEFVALRDEDNYAIESGRLISNRGLNISADEYEEHFKEIHVAHSNALQSTHDGHSYFVGPMARYNLNWDKLPPMVQLAAHEAGLGRTCNNPFKSIIIRAVETMYACGEALRIIEGYRRPEESSLDLSGYVTGTTIPMVPVINGATAASHDEHTDKSAIPATRRGCSFSEAPRGTLYHRYTIDPAGLILDAKIVPPTSQNQKAVEEDLAEFVQDRLELPLEDLTLQCEQAIRNYDPCISCATHFLKLDISPDQRP